MANEPRVTVLDRWTAWLAPATDAEWDEAYAWHLPRVYNFFRYRVGDGADAEDLTSVTFEKAWRARDRYRRDHAPIESAEHVAAGPTPEDLAVRRSDEEKLGRLLNGLPDRDRELLALKYGAGMTNRAIARLTGLTESNVGTLVHRAIVALRADWKEGD